MTQLNLFKYFKASLSSPQVALLSLDGLLSHENVVNSISAARAPANKEVKEVVASHDNSVTRL